MSLIQLQATNKDWQVIENNFDWRTDEDENEECHGNYGSAVEHDSQSWRKYVKVVDIRHDLRWNEEAQGTANLTNTKPTHSQSYQHKTNSQPILSTQN